MQFNAIGAMKHVKYLEDEKQRILNDERNNSMITIVEEKTVNVDFYDFKKTREEVRELDEQIAKIKHALNQFNTSHVIEDEMTIDKALVKLAQLNKELSIVQYLKSKPKESYEQGYRSSHIERINYSLDDANEYYKKLIKEIHSLQMAIDEANMVNKFEVEI